MYVVPNLFKYINFTFNLIEIEEDNIIDYAVSYDYNYISFIDIVNDVVKNDYNNIFFITDNNDIYNEIKRKYKDIKNVYNTNNNNNKMDLVIIDKVYINNKELLINIFESFYIQRIGSNMIFKIRLFDKIFYTICFLLSSIYNKVFIGNIDNNNYIVIRCECMNNSFKENILCFNKILTQIRTLKNNNRIVKSILHKDIIPQIYNNKYDEIIGYLYIDKKAIHT